MISYKLFHILAHGLPMIDFESFKVLFQMSTAKNVGKKHQTGCSGWSIIDIMHNVLLDVTKVTFASATFIGIFANKVMTIDYIQQLSIHLFVVGRSMVGWINFGVMQSILGHIG
jgi:hypothetical protein